MYLHQHNNLKTTYYNIFIIFIILQVMYLIFIVVFTINMLTSLVVFKNFIEIQYDDIYRISNLSLSLSFPLEYNDLHNINVDFDNHIDKLSNFSVNIDKPYKLSLNPSDTLVNNIITLSGALILFTFNITPIVYYFTAIKNIDLYFAINNYIENNI